MDKKDKQEKLDASFIISQAKSRNRPLNPYSQPSGEKRKEDRRSIETTGNETWFG